MSTEFTLPIRKWASIFEDFHQVNDVKVNSSAESLDITAGDQDKTLHVSREELDDTLYKFNSNAREVVSLFLRQHGIPSYYHATLVGFFDIHAYSAFIEKNSICHAIKALNSLFSKTKSVAKTDMSAVKLDHWILSDSIILVVDTNRHPLFAGSLEYFLGTCSMIMRQSMIHGFPLRGAIGGGNFYKDGEIMVSSGLVDAAKYEKKQNWLGAMLTPSALQLIDKAQDFENEKIGKTNIDFSSDQFTSFVRHGSIPLKCKDKSAKKLKTYYIKPFRMADNDWVSKYLPEHFNDPEKVTNSTCLYSEV